MKSKEISNLFFNNGLCLAPDSNDLNSIESINTEEIIFFFKKFGCILFRGFNFKPQTYLKFTNYFSYSYANDALRREKTAFGEYVKGVDKGSEKMNLHSEASFSPSWPEIIWFYCKISPKTYGETTICDGIKLWEDLSFETQNFFLGNPIEYHLNIPINIKKENKPTRVWQLNTVGTYDTYLDYSKGAIKTKQIRFAMCPTFISGRLSFSNHLMMKEPYVDKTIEKMGLQNNKAIPEKYIEEILTKSEKLTYYHKWEDNDLLMIDNKRFMHGRNFFNPSEEREILNTQTLKSKI